MPTIHILPELERKLSELQQTYPNANIAMLQTFLQNHCISEENQRQMIIHLEIVLNCFSTIEQINFNEPDGLEILVRSETTNCVQAA